QDDYVRVRKQDLDKLTTEVMQLREFLPRVLNRDLMEALRKVRAAQTNIAAVTCGRDFLSSSAHALLKTLMKLLQVMKPGIFPRLKVLMLMALYNVSISVKGLKHISESPEIIPVIWTLLDDGDWEVCLHALRLLQSLLVEEEVLFLLGSSLLDPELQTRVGRLTSAANANLRLAAQQTLEDLQALQ
ncbi:unnamed protein product, partial [Tetraodon nigroviridis]